MNEKRENKNKFTSLNIEWKEEWPYSFPQHYSIFVVTDENVLIDNIEKQMKENETLELSKNMLKNIGVKM